MSAELGAPRSWPGWRLAYAGFGVALLALIFGLYGDFAAGWDEGLQDRYGSLVLRYLLSGGRDDRCLQFSDLKYYGPLVELVLRLPHRGELPDFDSRHLLCALLSFSAVPAVMLLAARFRGVPLAPLGAGLSLVLMPRFFGHAFVNSKDAPFAAALAWSILALVWFFERPRFRWRDFVVLGVSLGLTMAVRPAGVLLLGVFGLSALALAGFLRGGEFLAALRGERLVALLLKVLLGLGLCWGLMIAVWPLALEDPVGGPVVAVQFATSFPAGGKVVRFFGEDYAASRLPPWYMPAFLAIATPVVLLFSAGLGFVSGGRSWRGAAYRERLALALCGVWLFLPLVLLAVTRSPVYDGLRHFLFILPALAVFSGLGLGRAWLLVSRLPGRRLIAGRAALCGLLLWPAVSMARLHPYQAVYFNALVGGVGGAADRFQTDYWCLSYKEGIGWLNERAEAEGGFEALVVADGASFMRCVPYQKPPLVLRSRWFTSSKDRGEELEARYRYFLATTRYGLDQVYSELETVHKIGRDGAVFAVIKARRRED